MEHGADRTNDTIQAAQQLLNELASHHRSDEDELVATLELHSSELRGTEMPESIRDRIPTLTDFVLYGDPVAVPEWVGELTNLTFMSIDAPHTTVPDSIGNLTNLTWLELHGKQL